MLIQITVLNSTLWKKSLNLEVLQMIFINLNWYKQSTFNKSCMELKPLKIKHCETIECTYEYVKSILKMSGYFYCPAMQRAVIFLLFDKLINYELIMLLQCYYNYLQCYHNAVCEKGPKKVFFLVRIFPYSDRMVFGVIIQFKINIFCIGKR